MKTLRRVIAVISLVLVIVLTSYCVYTLNAYKENIQSGYTTAFYDRKNGEKNNQYELIDFDLQKAEKIKVFTVFCENDLYRTVYADVPFSQKISAISPLLQQEVSNSEEIQSV